MSVKSQADIVAELAGLLSNFEGREYSGYIGPETLMFGELGFTSIEAVILGEELEAMFGRKLAFNRFLAQLKQRNAEDLSVGELAAFLHEELQTHI